MTLKIQQLLENPKVTEGDVFELNGLKIEIGERDVHALNILGTLYRTVGAEATYANIETILNEAMWWHITLNILVSQDGGDAG